jgi:hypothetical protein
MKSNIETKSKKLSPEEIKKAAAAKAEKMNIALGIINGNREEEGKPPVSSADELEKAYRREGLMK